MRLAFFTNNKTVKIVTRTNNKMNPKFLALQSTYQEIEIALYQGKEQFLVVRENKIMATKNLVLQLQKVLTTHAISLADLSFVAVNCGPGPFTTLRTIIASVNGLGFATNLPLISVNGLEAFARQCQDAQWPNTTYLLNAFSQDVYFYHQRHNAPDVSGCQPIVLLIDQLKTNETIYPIRFLGNGAELHRSLIQESLGGNAYLPQPSIETCSIDQIAQCGLANWLKNKSGITQIYPYYLKNSWPTL